jgi:hypothetical protein
MVAHLLKTVACSLALGVVCLAAQLPATPVTSGSHTTGCHGHQGEMPSPAPASYECCRAGHDSAILQGSFSLRPSIVLMSIATEFKMPLPSADPTYGLHSRASASGGMPERIPLRI